MRALRLFARTGLGGLAAGLFAFSAALATVQPDTHNAASAPLPSLEVVSQADRAQGEALLQQALPLLLASNFDRAAPLAQQIFSIYERAWPAPPGLSGPVLDEAALVKAALALGPDRLEEAEFMIRYAIGAQFRFRENSDKIAFGQWPSDDGDRIAALAIVLHRRGEDPEAKVLLGLLASSQDLGVRQAITQPLLEEVRRLRDAGQGSVAEATSRFAIDALSAPAAAKDKEIAELNSTLVELLQQRGAAGEAGEVLAGRVAAGTVEERFDAERKLDATLVELFASGREDRARALLAQITNANADDLGLGAAAKLDDLAGRTEDAAEQEKLLRMALAIYERKASNNDVRLNRAIGVLALTLKQLHRLDEAERLYRRALGISERGWGVDSVGAIEDMIGLAEVLQALARPAEAEAVLRRTWTIVNADGDLTDIDRGRTAEGLSAVLLAQAKLDEADAFSRDLLSQVDGAAALPGEHRITYYLLRATVLQRSGRFTEAEALLRKAEAALPPKSRTLPGEVPDFDRFGGLRAEIAAGLAAALTAQGKFAEAEPLRRAYFEGWSLTGTQADDAIASGTELGKIVSLLGRADEADRIFNEAGKAAHDVFGTESRQVADVSRAHALHLLRSGQPSMALEQSRTSLRAWAHLQDRINPSAGEGAYLERMRQQKSAAWLFARTALAASPAPPVNDEVFEALQRSELTAAGAALSRKLAREAASQAGAAEEAQGWQDAQRQLAALDARIADFAVQGQSGDAARIAALKEREGAEQRLATAEVALRERFPRFFDLLAAKPVPLDFFTGAQSTLRTDEALVLLATGAADLPQPYRNGLVMVLTRDKTTWAPIPIEGATLANDIYLLHQELSAEGSGGTDADGLEAPTVRFSRERAHRLYKALFGDPKIAASLAGKQRWTLAPQGALISLPFAALVTAPPPGGAAGDTDPRQLRATGWLGLERTLAIVPSVPSIVLQRNASERRADAARTPFFGLGDPAFRGIADPLLPETAGASRAAPAKTGSTRAPEPVQAYFRGATANPAELARLSRLTGTASEVRSLSEILEAAPGSVILQMEATEAEVRRRNASGDLGRAEVIAFATHGLVGGELADTPAEPALAMTPPAGGGVASAENDGLLTASEAATLNLSARLLILSACNTAAGGSADAESLSGLARAFFYAGARSMLVSHFPIFDAAAPFLRA